ncbi:S9 family peptidase [Sediminitomix flava]|uniref:Dipeptidyl-peptidase-4 n=1 Tax=Sediminitomix flava TaxID=379075 RepID=A0A315Z0X6_SEDFL|nr:DPP IV N-terminal domain-containing protein [Sediminitomix flava]PWJ36074.1 dipeptidyl-peptidase-4 [Sediminitomix flava]
MRYLFFTITLFLYAVQLMGQAVQDSSKLTLDRIFASSEFRQEYAPQIQWIDGGEAYITISWGENGQDIIKYKTATSEKSTLVSATELVPEGKEKALYIEEITLSEDESKLLIFTNSSRVWRANTKGDYWIYDLKTKRLSQIGKQFPASTLMYAKFSSDNSKVAYVQAFNLYVEELETGTLTQLTTDGGEGIINGTFDWAYEEEFGCRDGFRWNENGNSLAFWQVDASKIGTFYMINTTDSIYSKPIPIQYPKVGQDPSSAKIGVVSLSDQKIKWIPLEGSSIQHYIPSIQWVNEETLLIQRMNRLQNELVVWTYNVNTEELKAVYTEKEDTWVDLNYNDISADNWGANALQLVDDKKAFLRMTENDAWRHIYKVNIKTGEKTLLTDTDFDVASFVSVTSSHVYFHASPTNSTQRYLYRVDLKGKNKVERITPKEITGTNLYNCSPNGKYAIYKHNSALEATAVDVVSLPKHKVLNSMVSNNKFSTKVREIALPEVEFTKVTTEDGLEIDVRMVKPINFDPNKKYPVLFHVYGEPWVQVATDSWIGMWNIYLAQQGYVVIDMDNRGTPCLKGSKWRKSIYRKVGVINAHDQAMAAKEILKLDYLDNERTAVWGWSGGGSMTLNLMFKYPEIYTTGMAVAAVSDQLIYDNIYQERYMGLPQDNLEDFVEGSPVTHAHKLEGNLLVIHGTADDNVHYQSMELLVNELIKHNKQFQMMSYPNRAHGIYEGKNTRRHLYTLLTNYLKQHVPVNTENGVQ